MNHKPDIVRPEESEVFSFHGTPVRIVAPGDSLEGFATVVSGDLQPGSGAPPHSHSFEEGFWMVEGEQQFTAGNQTVTLGAGDFIQIRAGVAHYPENKTNALARSLVIAAPAGFERFQQSVGSDKSKMITLAPQYGIDLAPPAAEFEKDPEITIRRAGAGESIAAAGDIYRFLVTGEETGGRYALWHGTIFPGSGPPPHTHANEAEFFYVLSGQLTIYDDGTAHQVTPGTSISLPRGTRHWFKNEGTEPAEMLMMVAPAGLENMFRQTGRPWTLDQGFPGHMMLKEKEKLKSLAPEFGVTLG